MEEIKLVKKIWEYMYLGEKIEKADCILGLGTYDLNIPQKCAELYHQGYANKIIFSGALGKQTDEMFKKSEAQIFAEIAMNYGVPENKIYIEDKATNTGENIKNSFELMKKENINIKSCIIVQKPYMQRRIRATFEAIFQKTDIKIYITSPDISFDEYFKMDLGISKKDIINNIVSDLQRIKIYPEKGFQTFQEIPIDVWKAYEILVELGYDKYVVKTD
jgi:Uncharacterized conserved protein